MNPEIVTFGCRLNISESEAIAKLAGAAGLTDTVIVNTCAVTSEAERQARQAIRRIRRERPGATIVVTGCAAQIDPRRYATMPEVSRVVGNIEKLQAETWNGLRPEKVQVADIMRVRETAPFLLPNLTEHTRAFVEVQQGCDHRCTFCIIPFGRGPSRSTPPEAVIAQLRHHARHGVKEAVLTGVDLTSWGHDLPGAPTLAALARRILDEMPELPRLRLSSLDPAEIDDGLLQLFADEMRLMPHLHLSLQAGDDLILKRMKRRHSRAQAIAAIGRARQARPGIALGADLISGFPTEDEAMFGRTLALIDEAGLDLVHVFPFSPRAGTPAARMPQLPAAAVHDRARRLREAAAAAEARFLARQIGTTAELLVEKSGRFGHAENFAGVALDTSAAPGSLVAAVIGGVNGRHLAGAIRKAAA